MGGLRRASGRKLLTEREWKGEKETQFTRRVNQTGQRLPKQIGTMHKRWTRVRMGSITARSTAISTCAMKKGEHMRQKTHWVPPMRVDRQRHRKMHSSRHPAALTPPTVHSHPTCTTTPRHRRTTSGPRARDPIKPKRKAQDVPFHLWHPWYPPTAARPPRRPPRKIQPSGCAGSHETWPWRQRAPRRRTEAHRRVRQAPLGGHYRG